MFTHDRYVLLFFWHAFMIMYLFIEDKLVYKHLAHFFNTALFASKDSPQETPCSCRSRER